MYINYTVFCHLNFNSQVFSKFRNNCLIRKNYFSKIKKNFLIKIKSKIYSEDSSFSDIENGKIISADLHSEMSRSYMEYAMSVIYGRALPDVRDGLKPVHRRILFAMSELGLNPDTPFRKCARVVGEVLGKYHPHGDTAVYDALVRMAQDFSMRSVMIFGHGNFGSIDHDPPAAMRYTECKISLLSKDLVLKDIYKKTTNFVNNFDGSCSEPEILPTRIPILLLNGSNGIAVGMATNIPPHNLTEILKALESLIKDPKLSDNDIVEIIPAPDFPTGGLILGLQGCSRLYKTGQGSIIMRAKTYYESNLHSNKIQKNSIIVTEIPYQVNKANLLSKIAELVNNKIIEGIVDLRDESDRDGVRVVIELKKDSNKEIILNSLFKKTPLQSTYGAHFLALVGHQPFTLTLRELLLLFIQFRKQTIRKLLQFELSNAVDKNHIVNGLTIATYYTEFILSVIRRSFNTTEAKMTLMESGMTLIQGEAVLNIQLRRLTKLETTRLKSEGDQLESAIQRYKENLVFSSAINNIILNEFNEIANNFGMPRRTSVIFSKTNGSIDETEMISNFSTIIMVTKYYIKRMITEIFESQTRGTRGKKGLVIQENDNISHFFSCKNLDTVMCISQSGIAFAFKAFRIPISSRIARGVSLSSVLPNIDLGKIASIIPITSFLSDHFLILLTKNGIIKKTPLQAFKNISARGLVVLKINTNDELGWVRLCKEIDSVLISTKKGRILRFIANQKQLKATGRTSMGKNSMNVENNDSIVDMDILSNDSDGEMYILAITKLGYGKKTLCSDFKVQNIGKKGIMAIKLRNLIEEQLVSMRCCKLNQEVLLSTQKGTVVRQKIGAIATQGRSGTGVIVQKLIEDDFVSKVSIIPNDLT